ncbi:hypothetical protein BDN70DRAFT_933149 [Pholiota conissans]|uniref:WW domain-containing protein n=1 Tax=Pholiota conissans TaxID=109636 RepID=A0A9P5YZP5_9AGAR|nr:hypothetical protein BDN70DRAFT_933149 [Pholiota conissans]
MSSSIQNPTHRPLPDGWIEHFDSQRNLWYYVDLNSDPPRVVLVHPSELTDKHPSSAPAKVKDNPRNSPSQRPVGPRQSASTSSSSVGHSSQRPRRATVAQQLYASSLSVAPGDPLLATIIAENSSRTSPQHSSGSSTSVSENIVSNSSSSSKAYSSSDTSASSSTRVSPTSPVTSSLSIDAHNPRKFLDYTRLVGTRRVTYSGPQPFIGPRSSGKTLAPGSAGSTSKIGADAFYPGSVRTSPSILTQSASLEPPSSHHHPSTLPAPKSHQMKAALNPNKMPSSSDSSAVCPQLLITAPVNVARSMSASIEAVALTADAPLMGKGSRLDETSLNGPNPPSGSGASVRPLPPTTKLSSNRNNLSLLVETTILQPKPVRPLAGVSLNLQVQVANVASESSAEHSSALQDFPLKRKKTPLLQNPSLNLSKNAKGKTPIRTIYDRLLLSSSPVSENFTSL